MSSINDYLDVQMESLIPSLRYFRNHFFGSPQVVKRQIVSNNTTCANSDNKLNNNSSTTSNSNNNNSNSNCNSNNSIVV